MKARRFIAFWDNVRLAVGTLASNPLRSLLTLLGVVIGVTTVVTMMALVEGLRTKVTTDLVQARGQRLHRLQVARRASTSGGSTGGGTSAGRTSGWRTSARSGRGAPR